MNLIFKRIIGDHKGFTVIELLVVLTILGIVLGAVSQFFLSNYTAYFGEQDRLTVHEEALKASDAFKTWLLPCNRITSITASGSGGNAGNVTAMTFVINNQGVEETNTIQILDNSLVEVNGTSNTVIATNIESITMQPYRPNLVVNPAWSDGTHNDFVNAVGIGNPTTSGLRITLNLRSNRTTESYTQEVFFRNAP